MFLLLFISILCISSCLTDEFTCPNGGSPYLSVDFPPGWTDGSLDCFNANATRPDLDIVPINNDTYILRENKCINYEAPFMYLLFSNQTVLLIDSGATVSLVSLPIQQHIETIILHWCISHNKKREDVDLVVAHTHSHDDHIAGDNQFKYKLYTTIVNASVEGVTEFFKLEDWPNKISRYELDSQRHLAIIPIPGHEASAIAFYDCATGILITGDSLAPARLYISDFSANVQSISRLVDFIDNNHLNVTSILGAHIEMTKRNQVDYPLGSTYQPNERQLNMSLEHLHQLNSELQAQSKAGFENRHKAFYDAFIIDPKPSQLPLLPPNGRHSGHGFFILPMDRLGYVWITHKPAFESPHDYQLVFLAYLTNSTIDPLPFPTNVTRLNNKWSLMSESMSLNNLINGNLTTFRSELYVGDFEQSGTFLGNVTVNIIHPLLTVVQLNESEIEPYQTLRYTSYLLTNSTLTNEQVIHFYFLHQIRVQPDFDTVVHVTINPANCTTDIDRNQLNDLLEQSGNQWAFHGIENDAADRLTRATVGVRAQLLGDVYSTSCPVHIVEEIQCTIGPDFSEDCNV